MPELDAIRGLAALAIVIFHFNPSKLPWGWAAVDLFFVLSGYLITAIVLRHGDSPGFLARFYVRRGLRVWPIYYLAVASLIVASPWLPRKLDWNGLPLVLTFTQGLPRYWGGDAPTFSLYLGHAWTLAIEEQFYLVWPAAVLLVGRRGVIPLAVGCVAIAVGARSAGWHHCLLGTRGDGLALGGLLAAVLAVPSDPTARIRLARRFVGLATAAFLGLVAIRVLAGAPPRSTDRPYWPGPTILAVNLLWTGLVGATACRAGARSLRAFRAGWLTRLGTVSYGLYLYHFPIITFVNDVLSRHGIARRPSWLGGPVLLACLLAAWASWVAIERPILAWKDRFAYTPVSERAWPRSLRGRGRGPATPDGSAAEPARR